MCDPPLHADVRTRYGLGQALDVGGAIKGMWNNWVGLYLLVPVTPPDPDQMVWVLPG